MNKTLSTLLMVIAVLVLASAIFFAGSMYSRFNALGPSMMGDWNNSNTYRPGGMMGNGRGPSMMGGYPNNNGSDYGPGGMMGNGGNMMNGYNNNANLTPLTIEQAKAAAEQYLASLNNSDLEIAEIMVFDNNSYIVVKEAGTSNGAFELLVDSSSQVAYPEHGPNMMWNVKYSKLNHENMMGGSGYGMMGRNSGMMQGWDNTNPIGISATMTVTPEQAIQYAQKYLDSNVSGSIASADPIQFYGYYTLDFEKDGKVAGMLSVNGYSGQVFLHTWHGTFIEETSFE